MDYWGGGGGAKGYVAPPSPLSNYWGGPGPLLPRPMIRAFELTAKMSVVSTSIKQAAYQKYNFQSH